MLQFIPLLGTLLDRILPDKNAAQKAKDELAILAARGELDLLLGQLNVNAEEAKSDNLFVAGWRPSIGWVCSVAFAYHFVFYPIVISIAAISGADTSHLPVFDMSSLMTVLGGMLGLGAFRTLEKVKGVK